MEDKQLLSSADRAYLWLLSFYPREYQKKYGEQMLYIFQDLYKEEIQKNGEVSIFFVLKIFTDFMTSMTEQHIDNLSKQKKNSPFKNFITKLIGSLFGTIVTLLFLTPIIADLLFVIPQTLPEFQINLEGFDLSALWPLMVTGAIMSIVIYLITSIHFIVAIFKTQNKVLISIEHLYKNFRSYILISNALSLSTFIMLSPFILPLPFIVDYPLFQGLTIKFISLICLIILYSIPTTKLLKKISLLWFVVMAAFVGYFLFTLYQEFQPHYYSTFPLDDTKRRYVLNYDGDYWLTYYDIKYRCDEANRCNETITKIGNTSITEAPFELEEFIDKPIIVTGEFVKIHNRITGEDKKFCLKQGWSTQCRTSTGPGSWEASPLKIKTIEIDE